jgi:lipopolysaccharide/colanic/teichoic acid biosynthesis glycosyltransferase
MSKAQNRSFGAELASRCIDASMNWRQRARLGTKRAFDLVVSIAAIALLSPLLLGVAVLVRLRLGTPVFYTQLRPGLHEEPVRVCKFRTMTETRHPDGTLLPDAARLTRLGRFLREYSLDELPQLFNILVGDMSVVGPRPLLSRYLPRYTLRQRRRHAMKPGITGWAQVNGRNALDWESRLELDVWYVENFSLLLDLRIMLLTCWSVLHREGVLAGAGAELDEFWGADGPPKSGPRAFPVEAAESWPDNRSEGKT